MTYKIRVKRTLDDDGEVIYYIQKKVRWWPFWFSGNIFPVKDLAVAARIAKRASVYGNGDVFWRSDIDTASLPGE